ncbi:hypothetical protein ACIBEK_19315 [Nocardia fusca]|uniref:hypothetical protein n=1 Tax=Nocardia fusca TaxID=941183 RepID=UPI0037B0C01A
MDDPGQRQMFDQFTEYDRVLILEGTGDRSDMTPSGVMNRQLANTQTAISYALDNQISWLIHMDSDEIFYDEGDHTWQSWDNVGQVTFTNHEAVPVDHQPTDRFVECTLFRVNGRAEFMAYGNGKSAVRVAPGVTAGIHAFAGYPGEHRAVAHPAILHYPNPSFESWVAKFANYGKFSNFWWDNPGNPIGLEFMLRSRDLLLAARDTGSWSEARDYFATWCIDSATRERLLQAEALRRYDPMAEILERPKN